MYEDVQLSSRMKKTLNFEETVADLIVRMHADNRKVTLAYVTFKNLHTKITPCILQAM